MDLAEFKRKVLSIPLGNYPSDGLIDEFNSLVKPLVDFLQEDLNFEVLSKRNETNEDLEQTPLEALCRSVILELEEIDLQLSKGVMRTLIDYDPVKEQGREHQEIEYLIEKFQTPAFFDMLAAFSVLKRLDGHNKSLIVLGPNGSGKTTFAYYMNGLHPQVKVIPVPHLIETQSKNPMIARMCSEYDDALRQLYETDKQPGYLKFKKVKEIFDELFDVKLNTSGFSEKKIKGQNARGDIFDLDDMSDGERAAFFSIATVVDAERQSFIIVDEPESYLNPAIYNKLWDRLIEARRDCQFIFISHNMDFVSARSNYELTAIKSFIHPDRFEFDFFGDSLEGIAPELVIEILGSRRSILFCEGNKNGYDYKVYGTLFGKKYTVIPVGNSFSVKESVVACNALSSNLKMQSAIGIIDSDSMSHKQAEKLKGKKVFVTGCNEIEMLLIDEWVFKRVLKKIGQSDTIFNSFKNAFFIKLDERKDIVAKRLRKTLIDEIIQNWKADDKENKTVDEFISSLQKKIDYIKKELTLQDCDTRIEKIIAEKDYDGALRYCCLGHKEILKDLCNKFIQDYAELALSVLDEDAELSDVIKKKYFPEL